MPQSLWRRIRRHVVTGKETPKVDLKRELDLSSKRGRAELAKDVTAIANTPGGDGFIILGVRDMKDRQAGTDYITGFQAPRGADAFQRDILNILDEFCDPVPSVEYDELQPSDTSQTIGIIQIKRSGERPHSITRDADGLEKNQIWIRRGTACYKASNQEIKRMVGPALELPESVVINLSGRPLTDNQREQIQEQTYIEEEIEIAAGFQDAAIQPQIEVLINDIGLTPQEWQHKSIILALPGLSAAAAALLAYIHGLRGNFPKVIWLQRQPSGAYGVGEIIELQSLRDGARKAAGHLCSS